MIEKFKKFTNVIIAVLVIVVLLLGTYTCKREIAHNQDIKQFDQVVTALNDSIKKVVNSKGDTVFVDRVVFGDLDDITKTEAFKNLSKEKQAYYLDLKKTKGLLAASKETIRTQDSLIAYLKYTAGTKTDTSICFNYGDSLNVPKDTVGNLTYQLQLQFRQNDLKMKLKYDYKVSISSKMVKKKDGSIEIQHTLDDPNAKVIQGESFLLPKESKTVWQKIWNVTEKILYATGGFGTGYLVGQATK